MSNTQSPKFQNHNLTGLKYQRKKFRADRTAGNLGWKVKKSESDEPPKW